MQELRHVIFDCDGTLLNVEQGGTPYAGIPELLQKLMNAEFQIYVWTGRDRPSTLKLLEKNNLMRYVHDLRTSPEVAPKPYPQGLQEMLQGVDPKNCVMIGDSWADMKGGSLFGCHVIGAVWSSRADRAALKEFGAQVLVSSPAECYDAIRRIFQG